MSVREARANFSDLTNSVYYTKEPVIVEKNGRPVAVVINPEEYERWQQGQRERFMELVREIQDLNAGADPEEVQRDIDEAVEEVRQELYERQQRGE
jgi:prevent-host-death family protein